MKVQRTTIPAERVVSLAWCGDTLVDWIEGGQTFHLDGTFTGSHIQWAFHFDATRSTPSGRYAVLYQRRGTKAVLLRDGEFLRELNRSFYYAEAYEYPICLWDAADGRTLLAHCPDDYRRIDIEDADTGVRLTSGTRALQDFFHSRLQINGAGTRLLSAGWVWHPWDAVVYYDIEQALRQPAHLDDLKSGAPHSRNVCVAEESSACWQTDERVLLGGSTEPEDEEDARELAGPRLHPGGIAVYDVVARSYLHSVVLGESPGTLMALGTRHAISFYRHPKVVSLETGEVVMRWDDLDSGEQASSIIWGLGRALPPLALDPERRRFAVAGAKEITVIQIDEI